jgi:hypothetical protein
MSAPIIHGSSRHRRQWRGLESTRRLLGYEPGDGTAFPKRNAVQNDQ